MAIETPTSALPAEYDEPHAASASGRLRAYFAPWHRRALVLVALIATFCDFYQLQRNGYANLYYAAAIRSMLQSWHNFFFVSFDPGGFVSVDKPPLGFWIQTASAKLFGYSGFSILLPEALAGVASVLVLYVLVRRVFGSAAGLLAALFLAITPVSVVTNRNNTIDSLLVLTVLLAAYAVVRAIEMGSLRWLLLCAVLVGLGFLIKMLQSYLVVPALALVYLLGAPLGWWKRLWHLVVAGTALLAVSLSWVLAVDLTPASARPYVGSSGSNSELALALGYNGIQRLLGNLFRIPTQVANATASVATNGPGGPGGASENGAQGIFRLLNAQLGGQASWLLALGIVGILAAGWGFRRDRLARSLPQRLPTGHSARDARYLRRNRAWRASAQARAAHLTNPQSALVLWGMWTLTMAVFFSIAGFFHRYYLSMLAPGIAALAGIGVVLLWRDYRSQYAGWADWRGWLLPAAFVLTALTQAAILADYMDWSRWMTPLIVGGSCIVAAILIVYRIRARLAAPLPSGAADAYAGLAPGIVDSAAMHNPWADGDGAQLADNLEVSALPPSSAASAADSSSWLDQAVSRAVARLRRWTYAPLIAAALGVALLLVGPATWVGVSLASGAGGTLPSAGPSPTAGLATSGGFGGPRGGDFTGGVPRRAFGGSGAFAPPSGTFGAPPSGAFTPGGVSTSKAGGIDSQQVDIGLITYLEAHDGSATYLFATLSSGTAAPYIIVTGKPVMALGGFSGSDQILTLDQLKALIRSGQVKYFLLSGGGFGGPGGSGNSRLVQWIEANGTLISASAYGGSAGGQLYYVSLSAAG
jgi:4-amino-4-deoxy-L-arabinose transferase-like glycosyltransferase